MLPLYQPMFAKSGREFSSLSIIFLFAGTRGRTEDVVGDGIGLCIIRGTKRSSSKQGVASALCCSRDSNGGCRAGESYAGVTGIFRMILLNKESSTLY
jgi:hypothetical protein